MHSYYKELKKKVMRLVCARAHVEGLNLTGHPSEADMELAIMAVFENRDEYEAIRLAKYVSPPPPSPLWPAAVACASSERAAMTEWEWPAAVGVC